MPPMVPRPKKDIDQVVEEVGVYPREAYEFVQQGLQYTVQCLHGRKKDPSEKKHVTGQQLSEGLREFARLRWGRMARAVLARWNITRTEDFGRIVYALIDAGYMSKSDEDCIEDFRNVFDFSTFEEDYRIECRS